jgi:pimeloyl-ACP methyl ester carboxylesterase
MYLTINDHRIYYEVHGQDEGEPIVLLHHGLGSVQAWKAQIPFFTQAGYRLVVYDRWGYGFSDPRPFLSLPTFEEDLEDLRALLEHLGIMKTILVGHSDGGTIALYYAAAYPERIEKVIVVAAHIYIEPRMKTGICNLHEVFTGDPKFRAGLERVHGEKAVCIFQAWFSGWFNERVINWDMRDLLSGVSCPVFVVQGSEDEHVSPRHAQDLAAALPMARLWLVEGAAHMLPVDQPDLFNDASLAFLRGSN